MKLLRSMSLAILLLSLTTPAKAVEKIKRAPENYISIDLTEVPRDQPRIKRIFEWDQRTVVQTDDTFYRIDIENGTAVPIFCPGERSLIGVSCQPGGKIYALCKDERGFFLFARGNRGWDHLELPKTLGISDGNVRLLSNRDHLILLDAGNIHKFADGKWKQIPYQQHKQTKSRSLLTLTREDHAILFEDRVFVGHNWGEWGGGLVSLDLNTGKWQEHFSGTPVTGFAIRSSGELWVSQGLGHMGGVRGAIRVYDGKSWSVFSENKGFMGFDSRKLVFKDVETKNWPFDPAVFDSLSFDSDGNLLALSGSLGILRYREGKWNNWIRISPDQMKHIYVSSFFLPNNDTIIIGLYDGGIVVLNLNTGKYNRVTMAESFYYWDHQSKTR